MKCSLGISNFLEEISSLSHSGLFLYFCIDRWRRLSYLFWLFFGTLHSDAYIFPFLLGFLLLFFSKLFVMPPQTAILLFCISFPWGWSWSLSPIQCPGFESGLEHPEARTQVRAALSSPLPPPAPPHHGGNWKRSPSLPGSPVGPLHLALPLWFFQVNPQTDVFICFVCVAGWVGCVLTCWFKIRSPLWKITLLKPLTPLWLEGFNWNEARHADTPQASCLKETSEEARWPREGYAPRQKQGPVKEKLYPRRKVLLLK